MSAEFFFQHHPPVPELKLAIESNIREQGSKDEPVIYLAKKLAEFAEEGLHTVNNRLANQYKYLHPHKFRDTLFAITKLDNAYIIFSNTIVSLDDAFKTGKFNNAEFERRIRKAYAGTPFRFEDIGLPPVEEISSEFLDTQKLMREKDPTFTTFLQNPRWLPAGHRQRLEDMGILDFFARQGIIERWNSTAMSAVNLCSVLPENESLGLDYKPDEEYIVQLLRNF